MDAIAVKRSYAETLEQAWQDHLLSKPDNAQTVISTFAGCGGSSLGYSMAGFRELLAVEWDKHAVAVFKANFPDVPVFHGDIARLSVEQCLDMAGIQKGELDVLDGSPPCFPAGTQIMTKEGPRAIENIEEGAFVLTHTGKYHRVTKIHRSEYVGELVMIEPRYGRRYVTCTPNHQLFVKKTASTDAQWLPASELKSGNLLLEPKAKTAVALEMSPVINKQRINIRGVSGTLDSENVLLKRECDIEWQKDEVAWTLGLYLAEGHLRGRNPSLKKCGPCRREVIFSVRNSKAKQAVNMLHQAGFNTCVQAHTENVTRITISDPDYWVLCHTMGKYAHGKYIPNAFFTMPQSWQKALLSGYIYGDGYSRRSKNSTVTSASTVSQRLADGIAKLVANVHGVVASVELTKTPDKTIICGREVNQKDYYTVRFRLSEDFDANGRMGQIDKDGSWIPIRRVHQTVQVACQVYNLDVDSDHSYTANGFAAHNCQGFSTSGRRAFTDTRNTLFTEFVRLLRGLQPKVFVMENVSGLVKGKMKLIFAEMLRELKASGYQVSARLLNAAHYGVPQSRQRLIVIGVRNDLNISPTHPVGCYAPVSVRQALAGCAPSEIIPVAGKNLRMIARLKPAASGSERNRAAVRVFGKVRNFNFIRLKWSRPSPTIPKTMRISETFGAGLVMPDDNRYVSIAELKRLGSFPDEFKFVGSFEQKWARIGNSVPPLLMRVIAQHIREKVLYGCHSRTDLKR